MKGLSRSKIRVAESASANPPSKDESPAASGTPTPQRSAPDWAAILVDEQIATVSPLEGLLWVAKLQTQRMRSRARHGARW
ncbi:MAG: hypothetical protein CMJ64_10740 [Planctomycetaceae bacterium]|nr:hypothetical protein [Planctomycetaceae bacterium]